MSWDTYHRGRASLRAACTPAQWAFLNSPAWGTGGFSWAVLPDGEGLLLTRLGQSFVLTPDADLLNAEPHHLALRGR